MKKLLAILFITISTAANAGQSPEAQLKWLDTADYKADLAEALEDHDCSFKGIDGFGNDW